MATSPERFSLAIVEIVPVGGASEWGTHLGGANTVGGQASDYVSIPRVLEIINPKTKNGRAILELAGNDFSNTLNHKGMLAKVTRLSFGNQYVSYREDAAGRKAYYVPREHGRDDGYFGSKANLDVPSTISYNYPKTTLFALQLLSKE